jgi:hypothetical protein
VSDRFCHSQKGRVVTFPMFVVHMFISFAMLICDILMDDESWTLLDVMHCGCILIVRCILLFTLPNLVEKGKSEFSAYKWGMF